MTFNDMQHVVSNLAAEKKDISTISKSHQREWNALTQEQRTDLVHTYHQAVKYFQEWEQEDNSSTINNLNCLI